MTQKSTSGQSMSDHYDPHIVPAETGAREDREGDKFRHTAEPSSNDESIDTTGGYTVDQEGLANNYAVEPEMYVEVPGDLREAEEAESAERRQELSEVNDTDETGKLTDTSDRRGRGPGII
jgi:hypothetical protein